MVKEEEVLRRGDGQTILKRGQGWTFSSSVKAAKDRTRWKVICEAPTTWHGYGID